MVQELWREIAGYEDTHEVSNLGRIRRSMKDIRHDGTHPGKILHGTFIKGYKKVILSKKGKGKQFFVHRLVAETFLDRKDKSLQVNHIDGRKENNHLANLEWVTAKENTQHAIKNGLRIPGNTVFSDKEVLEIRKIYKEGNIFQKDLARLYNTTQGNITAIVRGRTWKSLPL